MSLRQRTGAPVAEPIAATPALNASLVQLVQLSSIVLHKLSCECSHETHACIAQVRIMPAHFTRQQLLAGEALGGMSRQMQSLASHVASRALQALDK